MEIIRITKSVCPVCLRTIEAFIVQKDEQVYFLKSCVDHGTFEITLSRNAAIYRKFEQYYFSIMGERKSHCNYELWLTSRCNMNCTICVLKDEIGSYLNHEPTCEEIVAVAKISSNPFWSIATAEPTCREDICEIIRELKASGKTVTLNTNGLKLSDIRFVGCLKEAGVDRIDLQFDGFNRKSYLALRGTDVLDVKIKAIENLKIMNVRTTLNATIANGINDDEVLKLLDFGLKNEFINGITYLSIFYNGGARGWPKKYYLMPDEIVDLLQQQSGGIISKESVYLFQKLHLAVKSFFSQRQCLYNQIYILVRKKDSYEPIDRFIDLKGSEQWLDCYARVYKKNKLLAGFYLILASLSLLNKKRSLLIFRHFFYSALSYFLHTSGYVRKSPFFALSFTTGCDPYKLDYSILPNCQNEIIAVNSKSGKLENIGSEGLFCIKLAGKTPFDTITTG